MVSLGEDVFFKLDPLGSRGCTKKAQRVNRQTPLPVPEVRRAMSDPPIDTPKRRIAQPLSEFDLQRFISQVTVITCNDNVEIIATLCVIST